MKKSVRKRFWIIFAALALGPLLLLGVLVIRQSYVLGLKRARVELMNTTRVATARIDRSFSSINEHLQIFHDIAELKRSHKTKRDDALSMLVTHKHENHAPLFSELLMVDPEGDVLGCSSLHTDCFNRSALEDTAFLEQSLPILSSGRICHGPVFFDHEAGEPEMMVAMPFVDVQTGDLWSVLLARIRLKEIWNVISKFQPGEAGLVFLIDDKGRVVAHANPSVVLRGTSFNLPSGAASIVRGLHGDEVMMTSETIAFGNRVFHTVTEMPMDRVLAPTYALIWKLAVVFSLALAAVVLMGVVSQRLIVNPLQLLAEKARKLGAGDLSQRVEVERDDEFGELGNAFNSMAYSLQQTISSLEEENRVRQQKEVALTEEKQFTDSLIASLPGVFYHFDQHGKFLRWNRDLETVSGLTADEMAQSHPVEVVAAEDRDRVATAIEAVFWKGQASVEAGFRSKTGEKRIFYLTGRRIDVGSRKDLVGVGVDMSSEKEARQGLEKAVRELEQANRELEHFTFATSHHLQEPLRKVQTFGDRLKRRYAGELNHRGAMYIERMQAATCRMQQMLEDLLLFSRIRSEAPSIEPVDLAALMNSIAADLKEEIETINGRLDIGGLPVLEADPFQMRVLFRHLIDNAFKFRSEERPPTVRVTGEEAERSLRVAVEDNGMGFDEKYSDRIFDPFQKLYSMDRYGGSGIGLAVCQRIVEAHGGRITATSRPGQGSCFVVQMPVRRGVKREA